MCDRVVILHRGRVLAADRPASLAKRLRPATRVEVEASAPPEALAATLGAVPNVRRVDLVAVANGTTRCRVEIEPGHDVRAELATRITTHNWGLLTLTTVEPSLEEAFLTLVAANERNFPEQNEWEAGRESGQAGRRGPGASEAHSPRRGRALDGPPGKE